MPVGELAMHYALNKKKHFAVTVQLDDIKAKNRPTKSKYKTQAIFKYHLSQCITKPTVRRVTSKDTDQPVHSPSKTRFLLYPSLDSPDAVECTCDQRRL